LGARLGHSLGFEEVECYTQLFPESKSLHVGGKCNGYRMTWVRFENETVRVRVFILYEVCARKNSTHGKFSPPSAGAFFR
jgi:hypothetical protein